MVGTCLLSSLWHCTPNAAEENSTKVETKNYSKSYKPEQFVEDNRVEAILAHKDEIEEVMREHMENRHIPGVAYGIVVDHELVVGSALGLVDLENKVEPTTKTAFRMASLTKSFTSMAILKLRDEGELSLNDPVSQYIPELSKLEYPTEDSPLIDIENLMTMTSGLPEDNPWGDRQLDESEQMLLDFIKEGMSMSNPPSYSFEYSNTSYALLGRVITKVSGVPYQDYITKNILQPLDMMDTYWEYSNIPDGQLAVGYRWEDEVWKKEPLLHDGIFASIGGLITTVDDFAKYVGFHLSAWPPKSTEDVGPVKRSTLREMHRPYFTRLNANGKDFNGESCASISGYGYGLGISEDCNSIKQVSHGGALPGYGCSYFFYPEFGVGVMAFGNLTYTDPYPYNEMKKVLFETIGLQKRQLPVSDILKERQQQIVRMIKDWDPKLEDEILAENFYLDFSRDHRMKRISNVLQKAGEIKSVSTLEPNNQLRGRFEIEGDKGLVEVFFTLTPQKDPKIQQLDVSFKKS